MPSGLNDEMSQACIYKSSNKTQEGKLSLAL